MSRLASLSTPTRRQSPSPSPSPAPSESGVETTHHRMLKLLINEFKGVLRTWDELVGQDGVRAGQGVVNEGTTMDNIVAVEDWPERELVGPHLTNLASYRESFAGVLTKLDKLLGKLSMLFDQSERIYFEAHSKQPSEFFDEPLWYTWTIIHFINTLPPLLHAHVEHLNLLTSLSKTILSPETLFDDQKLALERWLALSRAGARWEEVREWEELVDLELTGYGEEESEEEEIKPKRKGKGKK